MGVDQLPKPIGASIVKLIIKLKRQHIKQMYHLRGIKSMSIRGWEKAKVNKYVQQLRRTDSMFMKLEQRYMSYTWTEIKADNVCSRGKHTDGTMACMSINITLNTTGQYACPLTYQEQQGWIDID